METGYYFNEKGDNNAFNQNNIDPSLYNVKPLSIATTFQSHPTNNEEFVSIPFSRLEPLISSNTDEDDIDQDLKELLKDCPNLREYVLHRKLYLLRCRGKGNCLLEAMLRSSNLNNFNKLSTQKEQDEAIQKLRMALVEIYKENTIMFEYLSTGSDTHARNAILEQGFDRETLLAHISTPGVYLGESALMGFNILYGFPFVSLVINGFRNGDSVWFNEDDESITTGKQVVYVLYRKGDGKRKGWNQRDPSHYDALVVQENIPKTKKTLEKRAEGKRQQRPRKAFSFSG